jgi:hypothetical protein
MDLQTLERLIEQYPFLVLTLLVWSLIWKGLALWRAAKVRQPIWFVIFLVANTIGILELIYLVFVAPRRRPEAAKSE